MRFGRTFEMTVLEPPTARYCHLSASESLQTRTPWSNVLDFHRASSIKEVTSFGQIYSSSYATSVKWMESWYSFPELILGTLPIMEWMTDSHFLTPNRRKRSGIQQFTTKQCVFNEHSWTPCFHQCLIGLFATQNILSHHKILSFLVFELSCTNW